MDTLTPTSNQDEAIRQRTEAIFSGQLDANRKQTDRMFAWLVGIQWLGGVAAAFWISPRAWEGRYSHIHIHVWVAIFLGGAISAFPIFMALARPGSVLTRHVVAVGQMLSCGLLIHLMGGRIETHFQYFGALAFLAFYCDWRVLVTASAVAAADHFFRGFYWPQSMFGVLVADWWRWLEHAGWIVFEDIFLLLAIRQNLGAMLGVAERQAKLESVYQTVERQVEERTGELKTVHRQLLEASRRSGMAEIATNVLHNVGNVLNSVNISSGMIAERVKNSDASILARAVGLMQEHRHDLGEFISLDSRGKHLPAHLAQLSEHLIAEQKAIVKELASLRENIEHIKEIVAMQQSYATFGGVKEIINVLDLVEDSMRLNEGGLNRHGVEVIREYAEVPLMNVEKHKILQILVNLLSNAKHACQESASVDKRLTIRVANGDGRLKISVMDNGIGIPPENVTRIFNYGFTTRKDGHGFGLHSCALAAKEMGGSLTMHSNAPSQGSCFTLELPCPPKERLHDK
jgi:signal transduction histidine kinase